MNDTESLLTATLKLRISMKLLLRFSEQTDVNTDINTDFYVIENFFFIEEVFAKIFHFIIVMATTAMLRKAVRLIL